jgi:hypothetical protein
MFKWAAELRLAIVELMRPRLDPNAPKLKWWAGAAALVIYWLAGAAIGLCLYFAIKKLFF